VCGSGVSRRPFAGAACGRPGCVAVALLLFVLAFGATAAERESAPVPARLRLGSWNVEWLMLPATFDRLAAACERNAEHARDRGRGNQRPAARRSIPCDLVPDGRWSEADFDRLASYGRGLEADVIALQEVDGPDAARRLFPGFGFCFTRRTHVQNVGFAIRPGIAFRCNAELRELSLDGDPPEADLVHASQGQRARGCTRRDRHRDFVDHIVLSRTAARTMIPGSFQQHRYPDAAGGRRVPDHCAVSVDLDWRAR
jgi:hypothetical protein